MSLATLHRYYPGSVQWNVTAAGVGIDGAAPVGTPGPPDTVHRVLGWFGPDIAAASQTYHVPPALLIAVICTESAGGQTSLDLVATARREEPGFVSDAVTPSRVSMGCCQTLLSTARAALKAPGLTSEDLAHPSTSIRACAAYIASQTPLTHGDPVLVAAAYNAGGLYEDLTPANRWRLRCFPLGTGRYIDNFVSWYNDAMAAELAPVA